MNIRRAAYPHRRRGHSPATRSNKATQSTKTKRLLDRQWAQMSRKQPSWLRLSFIVWEANLEAQQVISLRLAVLTGGTESTGAEAVRMVSEKMSAALEVQRAAAIAAMTGNVGLIPPRTIAIYRQKIRANRRRLWASKIPAAGLARRASKGTPT